MEENNFLKKLAYHFGKPQNMTWSFPLMVLSVLTTLFFVIKCIINASNPSVPTSSLMGYVMFIEVFTIIALVLPAVWLNPSNNRLTGSYTGAGILIISALSGVPLMLVNIILYNLTAWGILRAGWKMSYPAFFYYITETDSLTSVLAILADTVIPAFGICLFFFGLVYPRFSDKHRLARYIVIALFYSLFNLSLVGLLSSVAIAVWCCYLREKTGNIWGPFLCILGSRISELLLADIYSKIDIYTVPSYSDVPSTFFYAALPGIFIALILLSFFTRILGDYRYHYDNSSDSIEEEQKVPSLVRNINFGLILAFVVFITLFILTIKGVQL